MASVGRVLVILDSLLYSGTSVRHQVAPTNIVSSLSRIHYSSPTSYVSDAQCVAISQISGYNHAVKQAVLKWNQGFIVAYFLLFLAKLQLQSGKNWVIYIRTSAQYSTKTIPKENHIRASNGREPLRKGARIHTSATGLRHRVCTCGVSRYPSVSPRQIPAIVSSVQYCVYHVEATQQNMMRIYVRHHKCDASDTYC